MSNQTPEQPDSREQPTAPRDGRGTPLPASGNAAHAQPPWPGPASGAPTPEWPSGPENQTPWTAQGPPGATAYPGSSQYSDAGQYSAGKQYSSADQYDSGEGQYPSADQYSATHPQTTQHLGPYPNASQYNPGSYPGAPAAGRPNGWSGGPTNAWSPAPPQGQPFPPPGAPNNNPRAPLGAPVPAAVGIEQFTERRSRTPLVAGLAIALAVALALVLGTKAVNRPAKVSSPSASASQSASTDPGASAANDHSTPFENSLDDSTGTWSIDKYVWSGDRLVITTTVSVTKGSQPMGFFAFGNDSESHNYSPVASGAPDDVLGKEVHAGETLTGTVTFQMPRKESTIFITDSSNSQVQALVVPG